MCNLIEVTIDKVLPYKRAAAKEGVCVAPTKKTTHWYMWPNIGFCGLIEASAKKARIKGVYVFPEERGLGQGTVMTEELIQIAYGLGYTSLEALALNPKWYEDHGWRRTGTRSPGGGWKVEIA